MSIAEQITQLKKDFDDVSDAGHIAGFNDGYADGYNEGYNEGYNDCEISGEISGKSYEYGYIDGAEAERKAFWDQIQNKGTRYWYAYCFSYWDDGDCYDPQYPFENAYIASMFAYSGITDTKQPITSRAMICDGLFSNAKKLVRVPYLDITQVTSIKNAFTSCYALKDITFGGEIRLSLDMRWSTHLLKKSLISAVNALSETVSEQSLTLPQEAVINAFGSTTADEWTDLINKKPNWRIDIVKGVAQ